MDCLYDCGSYSAAGSEATAVCTGADERFALRERSKVNIFRFKHTGNFLKCQDKIDIAADRAAAGLQLFRRAWADKYDLAVRFFLLDEAGGEHHRGQRH